MALQRDPLVIVADFPTAQAGLGGR